MQEGRTKSEIQIRSAKTLKKVKAAERRYRSTYAAEQYEDALSAIEEVIAATRGDSPGELYQLGHNLFRKAVILEHLGRTSEANTALRSMRGKLDELALSSQLATFYYRHRENRLLALKHCRNVIKILSKMKRKDDTDRYHEKQVMYVRQQLKSVR